MNIKRLLLTVIGGIGLLLIYEPTYAQTGTASGPSPFVGTPQSTPLCINAGLPFVWVRATPFSFGRTLVTLYPPDYAKLTIGIQAKDEVQWWVKANITLSARRFVQGWIEAAALSTCEQTIVPVGAPPPPDWGRTALCPKAGVSFVWERSAFSSFAPVISTLNGASCVTKPLPSLTSWNIFRWDGVQWWALVGHPPREWSAKGWIEANSLQPAS